MVELDEASTFAFRAVYMDVAESPGVGFVMSKQYVTFLVLLFFIFLLAVI